MFITIFIDFMYLNFISFNWYQNHLQNIIANPIRKIPAIITWILIALGILIFVNDKSNSISDAFIYGSLFGFISYGIYNFTNMATIQNWNYNLLIGDTLWGTLLCGIVSVIIKYFNF